MEIKTCEEYVVSRVMDLEEELDRANRGLNQYKDAYERLNERFSQTVDTIKGMLEFDSYTDMDGETATIVKLNVWSTHDSPQFIKLCSLLGLEEDYFEKDNA